MPVERSAEHYDALVASLKARRRKLAASIDEYYYVRTRDPHVIAVKRAIVKLDSEISKRRQQATNAAIRAKRDDPLTK